MIRPSGQRKRMRQVRRRSASVSSLLLAPPGVHKVGKEVGATPRAQRSESDGRLCGPTGSLAEVI